MAGRGRGAIGMAADIGAEEIPSLPWSLGTRLARFGGRAEPAFRGANMGHLGVVDDASFSEIRSIKLENFRDFLGCLSQV